VLGLGEVQPWTYADSAAVQKAASENNCDAIVVDFHEAGHEYLASLRDAGLFVIARDDLALHPFPCQMVVNGNADGEHLNYESSSGDTSFLLGSRYIILKEEFWNLSRREPSENVANVLVTLGGTDNHDLMPRILGLLNDGAEDYTVTAVVGPFFHNVASVLASAEAMKRPVEIVSDPPTICDLMLKADLAISAAGQTLYELAATGCPSIAVAVANNQLGQLGALVEAGAVMVGSDVTSGDDVIAGIEKSLNQLLPDAMGRCAMAAAGQELVDGQGAQRVAEAIRAVSSNASKDGRVL
jgi:spore coat polysaccharide biosynthesis predicted glycosyltransferase SpsG